MSEPSLLYPPLLRRGDCIGIAAPASPPEKLNVIDKAIDRLIAQGFKIRPGQFLRERTGYVAGTDEQRAADMNALFADPEVKAVFALRGGYGSCRILPLLDYAVIRANPKPLLGYSDITALHLAILVKAGLITFHGSNASSAFKKANIATCRQIPMANRRRHATEILFERKRKDSPAPRTLVPGRVTGRLLGGNFTCLLRLIGTPYEPDFRGAILFLEDTCEKAYRIDGMFTHLRLAGILGQIGGLVLGQFDYEADPKEPARIRALLESEAARIGVPCVSRAPIGHFAGQIIVPQGVEAQLDADAGRLSFRAP